MIDLSNDHREIKTYASEILEIFKRNLKNEVFSEDEIINDEFDILNLTNNPFYQKLENFSALENLKKFISEEGFKHKLNLDYPVNQGILKSKLKNEKDANEKFSEEIVNTTIEYLQYIQQIENDYLMKKRNKNNDIESELDRTLKNEVKQQTPKIEIKIENSSLDEQNLIVKKENEDINIITKSYIKKDRKNSELSHKTPLKENIKIESVERDFNLSVETRSKNVVNKNKNKTIPPDSLLGIDSKEFDRIRKMTIRKLKNLLKKLVKIYLLRFQMMMITIFRR